MQPPAGLVRAPWAAHELEAQFGAHAQALAARAHGPSAAPWMPGDPARVRVSFRAHPAARALLELRSCELRELGGGRALLEGPRAELERAAERSPSARCLLAAHAAATAAAAPTRLLGVLNATPDSFSDGGRSASPAAAIERGLELARAGAAWIDVGGESTRPGAEAVPAELELERVLPVVRALAREHGLALSVDTRKAAVATRALAAGACAINDVSAGAFDAALLPALAPLDCALVLMHARGTPADMRSHAHYTDVVGEVLEELRAAVARALAAGIGAERLLIDPGLGFAKTSEHSLAILRRLGEFRSLGLPLLVGPSRKSFLGQLSGEAEPARRVPETIASLAWCVQAGADWVRVHDLEACARALSVAQALARPA